MSLTDKIIKNTFYYILFQVFGFLFPLILTPFIISKIGEVQFGIYVIVLGFIGMFSLFDLSLSSSFIVFISKYFVKKDFVNLNKYFNTGLFFYVFFSILIVLTGFIFAKPLLSLLKIPPDLFDTSVKVYYIGLLVFFISTAFTIFSSVLISLQKMYILSLSGVIIGLINLIATIIVLNMGFGLEGIMWVQLFTVSVTNIVIIWIVRKVVPELRIGIRHLERNPVKEMAKFGAQMQVSKLSTFVSEKYDEFLLAYFSVLNNVTYFNIANKIARAGKMIPFQIINQVAPVASEFKANNLDDKIKELYSDVTKYLTMVSLPVFIFVIVFADLIITTWVGAGFEISANILRILAVGQVLNLILSAPGNSITPNIGVPKFQMREGLIYLCFNLILSFLLIKYYGIVGAAIGNVISVIISSLYIFYVSSDFFSENKFSLIKTKVIKPLYAGLISGVVCAGVFYFSEKYIFTFSGRFSGLTYLAILCTLFAMIYAVMIFNMNYLNSKDKILIAKALIKIIPDKFLHRDQIAAGIGNTDYANEKVSLFIVTYNRLDMLKRCIDSLLHTLKDISYELIIIDNASDDGTKEFLSEAKDTNERIRIITNEKNIGTNAKSLGADACKGDFILGVDDDVIMFPEGWIQKMVSAFKAVPKLGYLSTDVIQDETTTGAKHPPGMYIKESFDNGRTVLEIGPTGGWCFMIPRDVYQKTGKLVTFENKIFFMEDGDYLNRLINKGYRYGILSGVKVYHATGEFHNKNFRSVFENKNLDHSKGNPFLYELKSRFSRTFSINRLILKLQEHSGRNYEN